MTDTTDRTSGKRPIGRVLCVLGWHDYRWVGPCWEYDTPATAWGFDHECSRCGDHADVGYDRSAPRGDAS